MAQDIQFEPVQSDKVDFEPIQFEPLNSQPATQDRSLTRGGILDSSIPLKQRLLTALEGPTKDTAGHELLGPGLMKIPGLESLGNTIKNKAINTGNYYAGFGGSILGDLISGASTALDPRTAITKDIPLESPKVLTPEIVPQLDKPKPLGLPPAPREIERPAKFIAGPAGVAENKPYPMDIGPIQPNIGGAEQGTVLPRELEGLSQIQPDMAAREGLSLGRPALPESVKPTDLVRQQFNIGKPEEPYQLPSAVKPSKVFAEAPAPLDEMMNEQPVTKPLENVLPSPGQAKPSKDVSAFGAYFTSPDITLGSRPLTKPIADAITTAQDSKMQWVATTERELADLSKDLSKSDRIQLGQLIDGQQLETANPELQNRANQARVILDNIHEMFPEGATKSGEDVGYLENYFTHIHHQPEDIRSGIQSVLDHHFGPFITPKESLEEVSKSGIGDMYDKGLGRPSSPYVEPRKDLARKIEYDVNKVFPAYVESAAKVIFDKPAVEAAKAQLAKIPDSNLKELATAYIKNYTRYDSMPGLDHAWNSWASRLARTTSRSLLGWNTGLQTLHLARLAANMFPELGAKYSSIGLKEVATHPIQAWTEAAKLGLLQNEVRPFSFRTPMEKYDSISQFLSIADYLDKAIGYHGYKAKFLAEGLGPDEASMSALKETKRVSQTTDPARQMLGFTPPAGGNPIGTAAVRLGAQFKQVPAKIVEQYINIAKNVKSNPAAAARLMAGVGLALAADQEMRTFHLSPTQMIPTDTWGAFGSTVSKVVNALRKGDWEKAVLETGLWATPGGKSLQRQIEQGPSALNP